MTGDQHREATGNATGSPVRKTSKSLLTQDDDGSASPTPASQTGAPSPAPPPADSHRGISARQRLRKSRDLKLLAVTLLTGLFVVAVLWARGRSEMTEEIPVLSIAPSILFEQQCDEIRREGASTLHITEFPVDDEMVRAMAGLESLQTVIFDAGAVTDVSIETIAALPNVQHLRLRLSPIGDEGLTRMADMSSLLYLNLPHVECTAQGIAQLAALPRLRQLRLGSRTLGNEVAREIAKIASLRGVHLIGIALTDEGLKTIAALKHLESLYLDDAAVTDAGWEWLFREHPHLHVHVDQSHHDRDPKAHRHHEPRQNQ